MTTAVDDDPIAMFLNREPRLLIGGEWIRPVHGQVLAVEDPATGEPITEVAEADAADVDVAVAAARHAFEVGKWRTMSAAARTKILNRLAALLDRDREKIAHIETRDNGKPLRLSRYDVTAAIGLVEYNAGWPTRLEGRTIPVSFPGRHLAYTLREPVGVVGAIVPWNFPLLMAMEKLAPALAAGCTVVLKPAEETPLSALYVGELLLEAGLPPGVVNIVTGQGHTVGAALAAHPGVDKIAFTGSTAVGRRILDAARGNLKRVALELGGKSPNIIFGDADLERAIPAAALGIFFNSGQMCTAGSRLYVERSVYEQVVEGVSEFGRSLTVGPGVDPSSDTGPLVSARQLTTVTNYVAAGLAAGASTATGGSRVGSSGYFYEPTVLVDTTPDMSVVQEEIFGPVLVAIPFDDADEVVRTANNSPYGLGAGVWTRDITRAHRLAGRLQAGTVWINEYNVTDPALPFGGMKESGWGRERGEAGVLAYTEHKTVSIGL